MVGARFDVEFDSHPIRNWNCSNVASLADQINNGPMLFALLEVIQSQRHRVQQQLLTRKFLSHYDLATVAQCHEVKGGLAEIDPDRLNLHGDDPPSGFLPTTIITQVGLLAADHTIIA
jgi:hypothetical protein